MFTGLITHVGRVRGIAEDGGGGRLIEVAADLDAASIPLGASVAHSGVCLTVTERGAASWKVYASPETLARTTIGAWAVGARVNLERSLKLGDELGGHLVFGHVDAVGTVRAIEPDGDSRRLTFEVPRGFAPYVAEKGSVSIDGVSLTVNEVTDGSFGVAIIPHTWAHTTLQDLAPGDKVNLEADMLARYVERQLRFARR